MKGGYPQCPECGRFTPNGGWCASCVREWRAERAISNGHVRARWKAMERPVVRLGLIAAFMRWWRGRP